MKIVSPGSALSTTPWMDSPALTCNSDAIPTSGTKMRIKIASKKQVRSIVFAFIVSAPGKVQNFTYKFL